MVCSSGTEMAPISCSPCLVPCNVRCRTSEERRQEEKERERGGGQALGACALRPPDHDSGPTSDLEEVRDVPLEGPLVHHCATDSLGYFYLRLARPVVALREKSAGAPRGLFVTFRAIFL